MKLSLSLISIHFNTKKIYFDYIPAIWNRIYNACSKISSIVTIVYNNLDHPRISLSWKVKLFNVGIKRDGYSCNTVEFHYLNVQLTFNANVNNNGEGRNVINYCRIYKEDIAWLKIMTKTSVLQYSAPLHVASSVWRMQKCRIRTNR